jgi:hypothetical protein
MDRLLALLSNSGEFFAKPEHVGENGFAAARRHSGYLPSRKHFTFREINQPRGNLGSTHVHANGAEG